MIGGSRWRLRQPNTGSQECKHMVGYDGVVYQKDLGPKTLDTFKTMERYNPDKTGLLRMNDGEERLMFGTAGNGADPCHQSGNSRLITKSQS
jgi:hypothetical protein